ncbi:MAG: amidase [Bryobacteraceae bacterium]|nr:amidase [Bryobacteraceae bacterium]
MTIRQIAEALRQRRVSSLELTRDAIGAARRQELNAFITICEDAALASARERDGELARGVDRGPLHGVPIAHKDLFLTRGVRTTGGSRVVDFIPDRDAAVVERLAAAGAVTIGKTNMHELAYGITSANPHYGPVRNPHDPARVAGGSSGGSGAAVAAGIVPLATGSDTGGSIRIPASFCGVAGLKPTYGRVSRFGSLPLGFSLDHMGPLGASVDDLAIAMSAIAGRDPRDDSTAATPVPHYHSEPSDLAGLRIGLPRNYYLEKLAVETGLAVRRAFQAAAALGARIVETDVPDIAALNTVGRVLLLAEATTVLRPHLHRRSEFGADVLALLDQGSLITAVEYLDAQRLRREMVSRFQKLFESIDVLFTPATPTPAPEVGQKDLEIAGEIHDVRLASTRFVRGINVLGFPALCLPCGYTETGLPIGLQIVGPPWAEARLLETGRVLERRAGCAARIVTV